MRMPGIRSASTDSRFTARPSRLSSCFPAPGLSEQESDAGLAKTWPRHTLADSFLCRSGYPGKIGPPSSYDDVITTFAPKNGVQLM